MLTSAAAVRPGAILSQTGSRRGSNNKHNEGGTVELKQK
jgi:hypothetical protein